MTLPPDEALGYRARLIETDGLRRVNATDAPLSSLAPALAVMLLGLASASAMPTARAQGAVAALEGSTIISRDVLAEAGDTPLSVARRKFGSAAFARPLAEFNGLEPDSALAAGDVLRVPIHVPARGEAGRVAFVKGAVTRAGMPLGADELIAEGDVLVTGVDGFVSIEFSSGTVVNLQPNTEVMIGRLSCLESDDSCLIEVNTDRGELSSDVEARDGQPVEFRITTPFASAAVRGTVFETMIGQETLRAAVTEGSVDIEALNESVALPTGFGSVTRAGGPPGQPIVLLRPPVFRNVPTRAAAGDTLSWFELPGAIAYTALLSRDPAGVQSVGEPSLVATRLRITPDLASGDYHVALRGVDTNDLPGFSATVSVTVVDIDPAAAPVETTVRRDGSEFLIEVVDPPDDAPGFEIQASLTEDFRDPLGLDVSDTGRAVLSLEADTLYVRARTLIDPSTVSEFGPVSNSGL